MHIKKKQFNCYSSRRIPAAEILVRRWSTTSILTMRKEQQDIFDVLLIYLLICTIEVTTDGIRFAALWNNQVGYSYCTDLMEYM